MSKVVKGLLIVLAASVAAFIAVYIGLGFYYMNGFPCFTWINGVYCTGKSVDEVNEELCQKYQYDGINVTDISGAELFISTKDAGVSIDFTSTLDSYLSDKNPFAWGYYFFKGLVANFTPDVSIDEENVKNIISDWEIFLDGDSLDISIEKTKDSGYVLKDNLSKAPVEDKITEVVTDSIISLKTDIKLYNFDGCYTDITLNEEQKKVIDLFEKIDEVQTCGITYEIGEEKLQIDKNIAGSFIMTESDIESAKEEKVSKNKPGSGYFILGNEEQKFPEEEGFYNIYGFLIDENGNLILSENKMYECLYKMMADHGTEWGLNQYQDGNENVDIAINNNSKGNGLVYDINSEFEHLKEAYISGSQSNEEVRKLQYQDSVVSYDAKESLGETYI